MRSTHWPYIIVSFLSLLALGLLDNARGPYFPELLRDLNLTDMEGASFFIVASLTAFLGSHGAQKILRVSSPLWGLRLGLLLLAFGFAAMTLSKGLPDLLVYAGIFGFGLGMTQVFQNILIQEGASPNLRRRLFNGLHSMYALASIFSPFGIAIMLSHEWSWRKGYGLIACFPAVLLILSLVPMARAPLPGARDNQDLGPPQTKGPLLLLALSLSFYVASELALTTRLPLYLQRVRAFSGPDSSQYLGYFFVLLLLGRSLFAFVEFKAIKNFTLLVGCLGLSLISSLLGLLFDPKFLIGCGLFMAPVFGVGMSYMSEVFDKGAGQGISYTMAMGSLTIVLMHFLIGYLSESVGLHVALFVSPAFLLLALLTLSYFHKSQVLRSSS